MHNIFSSTLPIFLITLLGSLLKRKWLTAEEFWRGLEKLSYFLLFPAVLFNYISNADLGSSSLTKLVLALIVSTSIVGIALIIYRKKIRSDKIQFTSTFQGAIRYNSYIFFGLGDALCGSEGLAIVAVVSAYMIIFTNIISIIIFAKFIPTNSNIESRKDNLILMIKLVVANPLIIASIIGFIFNYSNLELNLGLKRTIASLSESALAIGMLNVGAALKFKITPAYIKQIIFTSCIKLIVLPLVTVIILSIMSITGIPRIIGVLYSCLPCATSAYILSRQLGGDADLMASIITFTTIFSVLTLSILVYILA